MGQKRQGCTVGEKECEGVLWGKKKRENVLKNRMYEGSYGSLHQLYKSAIWVLYS